jgi:hypothetical protein
MSIYTKHLDSNGSQGDAMTLPTMSPRFSPVHIHPTSSFPVKTRTSEFKKILSALRHIDVPERFLLFQIALVCATILLLVL